MEFGMVGTKQLYFVSNIIHISDFKVAENDTFEFEENYTTRYNGVKVMLRLTFPAKLKFGSLFDDKQHSNIRFIRLSKTNFIVCVLLYDCVEISTSINGADCLCRCCGCNKKQLYAHMSGYQRFAKKAFNEVTNNVFKKYSRLSSIILDKEENGRTLEFNCFCSFYNQLIELTNANCISWHKIEYINRIGRERVKFCLHYKSKHYEFECLRRKDRHSGNTSYFFRINNRQLYTISLERCQKDYTVYRKLCERLRETILTNIDISNSKNDTTQANPCVIRGNIDSGEYIVKTNVYQCISNLHSISELVGTVNIKGYDNKFYTVEVPVAYCENCACYFMLKSEYQKISQLGRLLCNVIEAEKFYSANFDFSQYKSQSILAKHGYNVKQDNGMTEKQRQAILANMIDENVLSVSQIISLLSGFAAQKKDIPNYQCAVEKWNNDIQFVRTYRLSERNKTEIKSIIVNKYRKI